MQPQKKFKINLNPLTIGGIVMGVVILILVVVTLVNVFRKNPYGPETRIDNLSQSYNNLPQNQKDMIFAQLYQAIAENVGDGEEVPSKGALIRDGTAKYDYNENTRVYDGDFIVDIASVKQSYRVQFEWSPNKNSQELGGYPVMILCVPKDLQIYESSGSCRDYSSGSVTWVNEYQIDYTLGAKTSARMRAKLGEFLVSQDETASYVVEVDETSLRRLKTEPDLTYQFEVTVNGENRYQVIVRTDMAYGNEYIAFYMGGANVARGFVIITGGDSGVKVTLADWLRKVSGKMGLAVEDAS